MKRSDLTTLTDRELLEEIYLMCRKIIVSNIAHNHMSFGPDDCKASCPANPNNFDGILENET